jgi:hypothetical protein
MVKRILSLENPILQKQNASPLKTKMSQVKGSPVFVYNANMHFLYFFPSANATAADSRIGISRPTIMKNLDTGRLIKNKYYFYYSKRI